MSPKMRFRDGATETRRDCRELSRVETVFNARAASCGKDCLQKHAEDAKKWEALNAMPKKPQRLCDLCVLLFFPHPQEKCKSEQLPSGKMGHRSTQRGLTAATAKIEQEVTEKTEPTNMPFHSPLFTLLSLFPPVKNLSGREDFDG